MYSVTVAILNKGSDTSPKFGVYFYHDDPNQSEPKTHSAGPIKPNEMWKERTLPFALKEGPHQIMVILDPDNFVNETDETNNRASLKVVVYEDKISKVK